MTHRNQFQSIYSSFKKRFHKEKGHFTSKEKGTFCVILKLGGGALAPLVPTPLTKRDWLTNVTYSRVILT
jgi:hypothetical protein